MLNLKYGTFVIHIVLFNSIALPSSSLVNIHPSSCKPQIASLIAKEALTNIFNKYADFADVFSPDLTYKLSKHTGINDYAIKLIDG